MVRFIRLPVSLLALGTCILLFQQCGEMRGPASAGQESSQFSSVNFSINSRKVNSLSDAMTYRQRLGAKTDLESPEITEMVSLIDAGKALDAAIMATNTDQFYNVVIRDFAAKMSNREQSATVPLNDFIATVIGITRDDLDAREMLTGGYFYWAPNNAVAPKDLERDVVRSNAHYAALDTSHANLRKELVKRDGQLIISGADALSTMADPAGVITSRAFLSSHAIAGTNRRLVEFTFSQFLCAPIEDWANTDIPDGYVGRDIGRAPAALYKSKCVGCHAPMDALRPAFAHINYFATDGGGFAQYKKAYTLDPRDDQPDTVDVAVPANEQLVPSKFRRNKRIFADGFAVRTDDWENFTTSRFGWRSALRGRGMNALGRMLADSRRFSECMARRAFSAVCYTDLGSDKQYLISELAQNFEKSGYRLRALFADTVHRPECTGAEGQ